MGDKFEDLVGQKIISIDYNEESLWIKTDRTEYKMYHEQDCCESVELIDGLEDFKALVGGIVTFAEESTNRDNPRSEYDESFTWTFYKIATIDGWADLRWYGTSNGYYSEDVSLERVQP